MKRSFLPLLMVAFLISGVSACAEKLAVHIDSTSEAPKTDTTVQIGRATKPADALTNSVATAEAGKLKSGEALKVILLQLLVAR